MSETIQELWSGYGEILRIKLQGTQPASVIAKHVHFPKDGTHPRGWNSKLAHQRKRKSYQIERAWYEHWSERCGEQARVPKLLHLDQSAEQSLLLLEDLDASGYPLRLSAPSPAQVRGCLDWLAHFHATFMNAAPQKLWQKGSYWQLETRSEELAALADLELKEAAPTLDRILNNARYQTIIHGDAKLANFCFAETHPAVAAVDFQYVGGGCGMKDLAYFLGSCLDESACERQESELLTYYFTSLRRALTSEQAAVDADALEQEWRALFPIAWADFHRFLKGWSPGHWKINSYSERICREVINSL